MTKANGSSCHHGKYLPPCLGRIAVPPSDWFIRHLYAQIHSEWFGPGEVSHFADQRFWLPARVVDWHETLELAITIYESSLRQLKCALISTGKIPSMETKRVCKNIELRDEFPNKGYRKTQKTPFDRVGNCWCILCSNVDAENAAAIKKSEPVGYR